jgi:hypothetical protein
LSYGIEVLLNTVHSTVSSDVLELLSDEQSSRTLRKFVVASGKMVPHIAWLNFGLTNVVSKTPAWSRRRCNGLILDDDSCLIHDFIFLADSSM